MNDQSNLKVIYVNCLLFLHTRYRCFVYKSWNSVNETGVSMALSGDATCNGLFSVAGGSMTLILKKGRWSVVE